MSNLYISLIQQYNTRFLLSQFLLRQAPVKSGCVGKIQEKEAQRGGVGKSPYIKKTAASEDAAVSHTKVQLLGNYSFSP